MEPMKRKLGMPNKFRESMVHEITKEIPENIEKILPSHTIPPWQNDAKEKRYAMRLMTNPAQRGTTKGEAANTHRTRLSQISQKNEYIITYTDGSMKEVEQENQTGAGWVIYWKGIERRSGNKGMGRFAEVYDAEMLALLRGLEAAVELQRELPEVDRRRSTIILFADNTSSVEAITEEKPGLSQHISQRFVEAAMSFLNENQGANIEVSWVPGHMNIEGNNRADELAKEATKLKLATETTTIVKLHWQLCAKMKAEWTIEWARKPIAGRYAISDRIPPSLAGSHAFCTLDQHILGAIKL